LFETTGYEQHGARQGFGVDPSLLKSKWEEKVQEVFNEATLSYPQNIFQQNGGKDGNHTNNLTTILAELQFMQRAYPDSAW
jgi:ring-1,2-phenylacetyl-CoA epoxidase subunit PaaC